MAQTICLWGPFLNIGNIIAVQSQLALRYGGSADDYQVSTWEFNNFLIRLPDQLNRDFVVVDLTQWCLSYDILITPWYPTFSLYQQPFFAYRLEIVVTGFPVQLWHEFFIIRFLSILGEVLYVNADNLNGTDKTCIVASIRCLDTRTVPRYVMVHFARFWKECRIHIRQWDDLPYIPDRIRPYPDFADPEDPNGDDFSDGDSLSPIRAHAVSCHDSLRRVLQPSPQHSNQEALPCLVESPKLLNIFLKASIRNDGCYILPEFSICTTLLCAAAILLYMHAQLVQRPTGTLTKPTGSAKPSLRKKPNRTRAVHLTNIPPISTQHTAKCPTKSLALSHISNSLLHDTHVDVKNPKSLSPKSSTLTQESTASVPTLSYSNIPLIPFAPQQARGQVAGYTHATKGKSSYTNLNSHSNWETSQQTKQSQDTTRYTIPARRNRSHSSSPSLPIDPNCSPWSPGAYKSSPPPSPWPHHPISPPPDYILSNSSQKSATMQSHDEISSLFASLASTALNEDIPIPQEITASRDWSLSCLARVITDRTVFDDNFINHMMTTWGVHPATRISPIAKHTYLIDFVSTREMYEVLQKEPWTYRSDLVAMRKVHEPSQLKSEFVSHVAIWTQFHNMPPEMLSAEGTLFLARKIGSPVSEVRQGYSAGKLFMKVKVSMQVENPLKDRIPLKHPALGTIPIYLVYERAPRLCSYCGMIGHEIGGCSKRGRVLQLCADPCFAYRPELPIMRDHRMGAWMSCPALVPRHMTDPVPSPPASPPSVNVQHPNPSPPNPLLSPAYNPHGAPINNPIGTLNGIPAGTVGSGEHYSPAPLAAPLPHPDNSLIEILPTPSNHQDCASPLHPTCLTAASLRARNLASANLSNRTKNLTIHDTHAQNPVMSTRSASNSPPPGYHKRLRAASPQSPPGLQ